MPGGEHVTGKSEAPIEAEILETSVIEQKQESEPESEVIKAAHAGEQLFRKMAEISGVDGATLPADEALLYGTLQDAPGLRRIGIKSARQYTFDALGFNHADKNGELICYPYNKEYQTLAHATVVESMVKSADSLEAFFESMSAQNSAWQPELVYAVSQTERARIAREYTERLAIMSAFKARDRAMEFDQKKHYSTASKPIWPPESITPAVKYVMEAQPFSEDDFQTHLLESGAMSEKELQEYQAFAPNDDDYVDEVMALAGDSLADRYCELQLEEARTMLAEWQGKEEITSEDLDSALAYYSEHNHARIHFYDAKKVRPEYSAYLTEVVVPGLKKEFARNTGDEYRSEYFQSEMRDYIVSHITERKRGMSNAQEYEERNRAKYRVSLMSKDEVRDKYSELMLAEIARQSGTAKLLLDEETSFTASDISKYARSLAAQKKVDVSEYYNPDQIKKDVVNKLNQDIDRTIKRSKNEARTVISRIFRDIRSGIRSDEAKRYLKDHPDDYLRFRLAQRIDPDVSFDGTPRRKDEFQRPVAEAVREFDTYFEGIELPESFPPISKIVANERRFYRQLLPKYERARIEYDEFAPSTVHTSSRNEPEAIRYERDSVISQQSVDAARTHVLEIKQQVAENLTGDEEPIRDIYILPTGAIIRFPDNTCRAYAIPPDSPEMTAGFSESDRISWNTAWGNYDERKMAFFNKVVCERVSGNIQEQITHDPDVIPEFARGVEGLISQYNLAVTTHLDTITGRLVEAPSDYPEYIEAVVPLVGDFIKGLSADNKISGRVTTREQVKASLVEYLSGVSSTPSNMLVDENSNLNVRLLEVIDNAEPGHMPEVVNHAVLAVAARLYANMDRETLKSYIKIAGDRLNMSENNFFYLYGRRVPSANMRRALACRSVFASDFRNYVSGRADSEKKKFFDEMAAQIRASKTEQAQN